MYHNGIKLTTTCRHMQREMTIYIRREILSNTMGMEGFET